AASAQYRRLLRPGAAAPRCRGGAPSRAPPAGAATVADGGHPMSSQRRRLGRLEDRVRETRTALYTLEGEARQLRDRIFSDTAALDVLTPRVLAVREEY